MFAPQSGRAGDDLDLNDLFADYFMNERVDPLRTINQSVSTTNQQQVQPFLPTGRGIRTLYHTAAPRSEVANGTAPFQQQQLEGSSLSAEPVAKKHKGNIDAAGTVGLATIGSSAQRVQLPVGVGIQIGRRGGEAQAPGGLPVAHNQWGATGSGNSALAHVQHGQAGSLMGTQGPISNEQAVAERRQRNREHAKRSRVRKKFMLESLQEEVHQLQKENEELRKVVQAKIPEHAIEIINQCCAKSPLFDDNAVSPVHNVEAVGPTKELVRSDFSLIESLTSGQQNFVLSDPRLQDNPIVYASQGFYELTGYTRETVLGRNCRFLQGPETDPKAVNVIRQAIANGTDATTCLLNYKADGTPFWNQFFVAALRDQDNCIVNYVGVQCNVDPEFGANSLEDKVNSIMPLKEKDDEEKEGKA